MGRNTATPDAPLHVASSGSVNTDGGLILMGDRTEVHMEMDFDISQSLYGATSTNSLKLQPEGGNVGVNTFSPNAPLHVFSAAAAPTTGGLLLLGNQSLGHLQMDYDLLQARSGVTNTTLRLQPNGGNLSLANGDVYVNALNNMVGIMDQTPSYTLDVNGSVGIDEFQYLKADNDTYLRFNPNQTRLSAGDKVFFECYEGPLDYIKIGDGTQMNVNINEGLFLSAVDRQIGIGDNFYNPTARLHLVGNNNEDSFLVQSNLYNRF